MKHLTLAALAAASMTLCAAAHAHHPTLPAVEVVESRLTPTAASVSTKKTAPVRASA